jgi:DNA polymerase III delta prime subunit
MTDENWLEKYRPKTFKDYLNYKDYSEIVNKWIKPFIKNNNITSKPFLILYGPPAYGKTTLAHCIFKDFGYEILECNASDTRNKSKLEKRIKTGKTSFEMKDDGSGFKPYGLVLDELDGLTSGDNGGVDTIMNIAFLTNNKLVKNNEYKMRYPIICTTNSIKEKKLLPILRFGELIIMKKPCKTSLFNLGKQIIKTEKIPMTQSALRNFISEEDDYRTLINNLYMLYIDIKKYNKLIDKKKRINELVERVINNNKILLKINNNNIYEIVEKLIINLNKYDKKQVLNVIDANNLVFYFTIVTNYYKCGFEFNELINNIYTGNKFLELFKKNKNDNYELIKYLNYIVSYGSIYLLNDYYKSLNNSKTKKKESKKLINMSYHTKYNDMKQDKSFYFNNLHYKFNFSDNLLNNNTLDFLYKRKIVQNKSLISNNANIINNIIDLDILLLYNNLNYSIKESGISKSLIGKLSKYISIK